MGLTLDTLKYYGYLLLLLFCIGGSVSLVFALLYYPSGSIDWDVVLAVFLITGCFVWTIGISLIELIQYGKKLEK